jgi:hypothetical protein
MQATALIKHLSRTGWPQPAVVEFMALLQGVAGMSQALNECIARINTLAIGHLVTETVMEHHGLWGPEVGEAIKPLLAAKMRPAAADGGTSADVLTSDAPEQAPEQAPETPPGLFVVPDRVADVEHDEP